MPHLKSRVLFRSPLVRVVDVRCRHPERGRGEEEYPPQHQVIFPRAGAFTLHLRGRRVVAEANQVVFLNGGEPYRVSHPEPVGDDCTVLLFSPSALVDALGHHDPAAADRPDVPFRNPAAPLASPAQFQLQQLRRSLLGREVSTLAVEEASLTLFHRAASASAHSHPAGTNQRPATRRAHEDSVEAARSLLAARPGRDWSLADLARQTHCSAFHLARVFRRHVGSPIHRYLVRLRLAAALDRLADSEDDLTRLAFDLGFSSHSHFTASFVQAFGTRPSDFRARRTGNGSNRARFWQSGPMARDTIPLVRRAARRSRRPVRPKWRGSDPCLCGNAPCVIGR